MRFAEWFKMQCGPRKHSGEFTKLSDARLQDVADAGIRAQCELRKRLDWDRRRTVALWAWQARD